MLELVQLHEETVLLVTHSFGAKIWFFFLKWIQHHYSENWIDRHVHGTYHVAPVFLGVPKAFSALLSGDTRDTAQLGALSTLLDTLLPPTDRAALTASWGSIVDMLPDGGSEVWPEPILQIQDDFFTIEAGMDLLFKTRSMLPHFQHAQFGVSRLRCGSTRPNSCYKDEWSKPLLVPLPWMQTSKIWCTYGVGIPTEVGYHYSGSADTVENAEFRINTGSGVVANGVHLGDGDGSVPTQSLGHVCEEVWRTEKSNPGNATVVVRKIPHGDSYSLLGRSTAVGGSSVDHVDIMGNKFVIRDILQIALEL